MRQMDEQSKMSHNYKNLSQQLKYFHQLIIAEELVS